MSFVNGRVTNATNGDPVENATVIIGTDWALSDDTGAFTIAAPISPGKYTLKVLQRDYIPRVEVVLISEDSNLDIPLVPS